MTLTPVAEGRFEVFLNGEQVYSRKSPPAIDKPVADVRTIVHLADELRGKLNAAIDAAGRAATAS